MSVKRDEYHHVYVMRGIIFQVATHATLRSMGEQGTTRHFFLAMVIVWKAAVVSIAMV